MPINIPDSLPATKVLKDENIFVMTKSIAFYQDIRPLKIAILNLMPKKIATEIHLLRLLSNTPLQVEIDLVKTKTYESKNTHPNHLKTFYKAFEDICHQKYDGMIITGAPVEHLEFEDVKYWDEIKNIMSWAAANVTSTLYICWAAQAGLFHHYGIRKHPLKKKLFGVYDHYVVDRKHSIIRGFDDLFPVPHSRYSEIKASDVEKNNDLNIISLSDKAGVYIIMSKNEKSIFITGHSEYDALALREEYFRDINNGVKTTIPENYFPDNDSSKTPIVRWRTYANLLFSNWLNYYVYQQTPYNLNE